MKRKIGIVFIAFLGVCILTLSIYLCLDRLKAEEPQGPKGSIKAVNSQESKDALYVQSKVYDIVLKDTKIVFKTMYKKTGAAVTDKIQQSGNLKGKTKEDLNELYSKDGYKVFSINSEEAVLMRELDRYEPDKYVLGIKDGYIAIFKTDRDGNMFIQNEKRDITDIKTNKLKDEDITLLTKGDKYFQCSTREDAQAILEDYE